MTKCLWDDFTESMHLAANMEGRIVLCTCIIWMLVHTAGQGDTHTHYKTAQLADRRSGRHTSLVPRPSVREGRPGTHCSRMRGNF